jgi:hypothetical protein
MFNGFDQPLVHPVTSGPLWCGVLMVNIIDLAQVIKFSRPFTTIVENKFKYPISTNIFAFKNLAILLLCNQVQLSPHTI